MKVPINVCIAVVFLSTFSTPSDAKTASHGKAVVKQCVQLKQRITHYQQLRRKGGSAREMDNWKRKINDLRDVKTDLRCNAIR